MGLLDLFRPKRSDAEFESGIGENGVVVRTTSELTKALGDHKRLIIVSDGNLLKQLPQVFLTEVHLFHGLAVLKGRNGEAIFADEPTAKRYLAGLESHPVAAALRQERAKVLGDRLKDMELAAKEHEPISLAPTKEELFRRGAESVMDVDCPRCRHTWLAGFRNSSAPTKVECPKCGGTQMMVVSW
jgi:ribosomal protein S27E